MTTRHGRFQCLGLAFILALGAGVAWGFLGVIVLGTLETLFRPTNVGWEQETLTVTREGTPLVATSKYDGTTTDLSYRTLDGAAYTKPSRDAVPVATLPGPLSAPGRYTGLIWIQRIRRVGLGSPGEIWHFVHDGELAGHGYLVGHNVVTRTRLGYIGRAGFRPDEPPLDDQFAVDGRRINREEMILYPRVWTPSNGNKESLETASGIFCCLAVDDGLVSVNLTDRTARPLWKNIAFISAAVLGKNIAVRASDHIHVLRGDGKELQHYALPEEARRDKSMEVWELPNNGIVLAVKSDPQDVFWLDATGKVTRREQVALRYLGRREWLSRKMEYLQGAVIAIPSPGAILSVVGYKTWSRGHWGEWRELFRQMWPDGWPALLGTVVISAVLAVFCYRRQRQYDLPWTGMWVGFVLLFGVPAYIGYLVHRHWPARLACPHCGQAVPRDREACFACGKDFPAPAPKGIEVFA